MLLVFCFCLVVHRDPHTRTLQRFADNKIPSSTLGSMKNCKPTVVWGYGLGVVEPHYVRLQANCRGGSHMRSLISIDFPAPKMEPEKRTCGISCLRSLAPMWRLQCSAATKSSTKHLAPTDPILGPENLLKTGFAQKGLPSTPPTELTLTTKYHPFLCSFSPCSSSIFRPFCVTLWVVSSFLFDFTVLPGFGNTEPLSST